MDSCVVDPGALVTTPKRASSVDSESALTWTTDSPFLGWPFSLGGGASPPLLLLLAMLQPFLLSLYFTPDVWSG